MKYDKPELYHKNRLQYSKSIKFIKEHTGYNRNFLVLDVACGTGLLLEHFLDAGYLIGLDLSIKMLQYTQRRFQSRFINLVNTDVHTIPLPSGCVDLVTIGHGIHWFDLKKFMPEVKRILKPNGWLATVSIYPSPKEPYRPLYIYLLHKWAEVSNPPNPQLLNLQDVGVGYISSLEQLGFNYYKRVVLEETVRISIEEYLTRGEDHRLYSQMTTTAQVAYKSELRSKLEEITLGDSISEINYEYVLLARRNDV